ncbi:MAG TPA: GAF domain-containing protein [Hydrogenophaga sp.]|mgnify:CR=1 FL=1|uniref:PAS domain-containing protein n=1 Tax=Hydrogenophaga sp. TaxID=1904254 RepID=UPI002C9D7922|nr:PAS domain-containing protein [Hydrogenophaga sp.]HMN93307.1 GAF domain-containing protein [Hydrogenophaga sp.]HMP10698.1 GAF domain-containing protein [Hydrogenophaga sp.]
MTSPEIAQVPGTEHPNKAANGAQACLPPLDLLFLSAPLPLALTRRSDGQLLAVNDAWVRFTGVGREQAQGQTTLSLSHWMSGEQRQRYLAALDAGESVFTYENYGRKGRRVRLHTTLLEHQGEAMLLVSLQDITREHEAEQRLIEANRRLQQQVELHEATERLARVGHWTVPEDEEQVVWSRGLRAIVGVDPDEELNRDQARAILHEDDRAAWLAAREAMDGRVIEFRVWTRQGEMRWVRSRMSHTLVRGNPQTDFGIVQDITAEKLALDAAAEKAEFVRQIAARVPGLIYQARLRPDGRSEIPFVNNAVHGMLELAPEDLRRDARLLFQRVHPEDRTAVEKALAVSARELTPWRQRYRAVLPKGGVRWYSVEAVPQAEPDGSVLWHGFTTDVTESHRASEQLLAQHRMLEAIRQAQASYIDSRDRTQVFDALLQTVLELTGSAYGFLGEVLRDADGQPYLVTHALSDIAWDDHSRAQMQKHRVEGMAFRNLQTLFGEVMTTGEVVIANRPSADPRSGGIPPGHPSLEAFMGIPVHVGEQLVAMVGLANRPVGYAEADIEFLRPLLATLGQLVLALRQQIEQAQTLRILESTSAELVRQRESLQITLDSMSQGISLVDSDRRTVVYNRRLLELLDLPESLMASQPTHEQVVQFQEGAG